MTSTAFARVAMLALVGVALAGVVEASPILFADHVVAFAPGAEATNINPLSALGPPDVPHCDLGLTPECLDDGVSLGADGVIVVSFAGLFAGSVYVYELWREEPVMVEVFSQAWCFLGPTRPITRPATVLSTDACGPGPFSLLRVTDLWGVYQGEGWVRGADIDALGATAWAPPGPPAQVPESPTLWLVVWSAFAYGAIGMLRGRPWPIG